MKNLKKLSGILLAIAVLLACTVSAFAVNSGKDGNTSDGKITIDNAIVGQTYTIYQILYLESYDATVDPAKGAFSYKANSQWDTWLQTQTTYLTKDGNGYYRWKDSLTDADTAAFAKLALAEAKREGSGITAAQSSVTASGSTVEFTDLNLGYYLVDSTLGTICSLDTTAKEVIIKEKNTAPTVEKFVKEDTSDYDVRNTAEIGDTVEFKVVIKAQPGAQNYVLHDELADGFTVDIDSIAVQGLTKNTEFTVSQPTAPEGDNCDFEITFTPAYLDSIANQTDIIVTYSALLNGNAKIGNDEGNINKAKLSYGDGSVTEFDTTTTYTYSFDIIKTNSDKEVINGAEFELYRVANNGTPLNLVKESEGLYRLATPEEASQHGFVSAIIEAGKVTVKGLDTDTYYLGEKKAPEGYNILPSRKEVVIDDDNLSTNMTGTTWAEGNGGVQITNLTGTELPSTGGIGTTIFYIVGGVLVAAAVVLLVAKKRTSENR